MSARLRVLLPRREWPLITLIKPERSYIVTGQLNHISMVWKLRSRNSQANNGRNVVLENVISYI